MKETMTQYLAIMLSALLLAGCTSGAKSPAGASSARGDLKSVPAFSADSAYAYIARQLEFGARVPGSAAQDSCAAWLHHTLERHGASVHEQRTTVTAYDGTLLPCINLVGSYNPGATHRVLLMSHWDSRPVADEDPNPALRSQPVPAANDGASGVGVLLEIARQASLQLPQTGIDILLSDVEDYGPSDSWTGEHREEWWGLGTQAWCRQPHVEGYTATYGILLDMVGAADATFYREYYSERYAGDVVRMVWKTAARLGYGRLFVDADGGGITDDHTFVNRMAGIPTIDIIDTRPHQSGSFFPYWHTTGDDLSQISRETLQKVGDVLMQLLW